MELLEESAAVTTPPVIRDIMSIERILATDTETPLVLSFQDREGRHFTPCLRQPSMKADVVKLTAYTPWGKILRLKLTWKGHGILTDEVMDYTISYPGERELASCWKVLSRYEAEILEGE